MLLRDLRTAIKILVTRGHIQRRILIKEIHRLQRHFDNLARHDGEVLDTHNVLQAELHPDDNIVVDDVFLAISPGTDTGTATGLIGVFAASEELVAVVFGDVDVVVSELGTLVVEGARVGDHLLEGGGVDLVGDWLSVDGVAGEVILNFVGPVRIVVCVETGGLLDSGFGNGVTYAVRVEF